MTQFEKKQEELIKTTAGLLVTCKLPFPDVVKELKKLVNEIVALKQQGEPVSAERLKIIAVLNSIIPMAEDALKGYKKSKSSHQEFIREDEEDIKKAKEVVITLIKSTAQQGEVTDEMIEKWAYDESKQNICGDYEMVSELK